MENYLSLAQIRQDLDEGEVTCELLVQSYLERIEAHKHLNAFLDVFADEALAKARDLDARRAAGTTGKLTGMVVGIKDNLCYRGQIVSASSRILENFESLYNATAVQRLLDEDAIIIGRLNCDEFAMGSSNENSAFGPVLNARNNAYVPGGSSGGSAVAVQAGLCLAALGSDTGGSIRQPASFCGIIGLKPTYGRISRYGLLAYASSFDQIGPLTHTIDDAALLLEVMAGPDKFDATLARTRVPEYSKSLHFEGKTKIAFIKDCLESDGIDAEVKTEMENLIEKLRAEGHTVEAVDFPYLDYMVPAYYVLTTAEASSNLSRYDGIHYGHRSKKVTDIESTYLRSRSEGFGSEVQRRIMLGTFVLSAGYYDAYYGKGQKVRRMIRDETQKILETYPYILLPTTPTTAFKIGENMDDPITMYLQDIYTVQANLAGIPAVSLPLGEHSNGLPFGIQVMARPFDEAGMLAFSKYVMALS